jgi:iron complex transport system ATP-binding protein
MSATPVLALRNLQFSYRRHQILTGVSFSVDHGEIVSLLGANGAGKSSLLRIALGLIKPPQGDVLIGGVSIKCLTHRQIAQQLAYVPQSHTAPFPFEVQDVVGLGRLAESGLFRGQGEADCQAVEGALERLKISHLAHRRYTEISGGERQLTLMARAIAQGARILVLDEPATGLDFGHQIHLLQQLSQLASQGYGILMTTHHPGHALAISSRVVLLKDGAVLKDGPPKLTVTPEAILELYGVNIKELAWQGLGLGLSLAPAL